MIFCSLAIVPDQFANMIRFVNFAPKGSPKCNVKTVRVDIRGRIGVLLMSSREFEFEYLRYDYNGCDSNFPTSNLVL